MHDIYKSKGEYDIEAEIPITVCSYLISSILNTPINFLALSNDSILNFKQNSSKINSMKRAKELKNKLSIKFIFFL